MYMSKHDYIYW